MDEDNFANKPNPVHAGWEFRLGYVLPVLFIMGAMVSLAMTQPTWDLEGFVELALHAERQADYLPDPANLNFAPVSPDIIDDVQKDQVDLPTSLDGNDSIGATPNPNFPTTTSQTTSSSTETPPSLPNVATDLTLPTLPSPTLPLPTLPLLLTI